MQDLFLLKTQYLEYLEKILLFCKQNKVKIATAESCTGGMLSSLITSIPGASQIFNIGIATYSNDSKISLLNVKKDTIKNFGAVSPQTAKEMTTGIMHKDQKSNLGIGITGIAGPELDTNINKDEKPVGLVYICLGLSNKNDRVINTYIHKYNFTGTRNEIRQQTCLQALQLITQYMKDVCSITNTE